jgi:hypothetical protein
MRPLDLLHVAVDSPGAFRHVFDALSRLDRPRGLATVADGIPASALRTGAAPVVSVVIPCYNYAQFLPQAVRSCLSQPGVTPQILIVDDCSTDSSAEVAERLSEDRRVTLIRNRHNLGHVRTFNVGLAQAVGEVVVRLDADDLLTPGSLRRSADVFEAFPDVGLVYGHPRHFTTSQPTPCRAGAPTWTVWKGLDWVRERCRRGVNAITTPEAAVRRTVLDSVGGLETTLRFAQDMELWLRVASVSDVAYINGVDQAWHRDHAASMSVNEGHGIAVDLQERKLVFDLLRDFLRDRTPDADTLHAVAMHALATEALEWVARSYPRGQAEPQVVGQLLELAVRIDPRPATTRAVRRLRRNGSPDPGLLRVLGAYRRAAAHRMRNEAAYLRWTRMGV